jgi:hypothetical protein
LVLSPPAWRVDEVIELMAGFPLLALSGQQRTTVGGSATVRQSHVNSLIFITQLDTF